MSEKVRHAGDSSDGITNMLCGARSGRATRPEESVNCPTCRVILNHLRHRYPEHASYTDWRCTAKQQREAAQRMVADMYGGADD